MRITRIVARDFLSYDDLDLDLSGLTTAAIVGPVGAGKSSLFEAITWGLWGKANRATVIRDDTDETMVQIEFDARGDHCVVIRTMHENGRNAGLSFIVNGVNQVQHIKAETQAAIDKKIGLDYESIVAGPLMIQMHTSHLMEVQPRERKDLLIRLFGVDRFEAPHQEASSRASAYNREAQDAVAELQALEGQRMLLGEAQADLANTRYDLLEAVKARDTSMSELTAARERQVTLREQARHADTLRQTIASLGQRIEGDQKEHSRVLRQLSDAHQSVDIPEPVFEELEAVSEETVEAAAHAYHVAMVGVSERAHIEGQLPGLRDALARARKMASIVDTVPCGGQGIYATCRFLVNAPKEADLEAQQVAIDALSKQLETLPDSDAVLALRKRSEGMVSTLHTQRQEMMRRDSLRQQWTLKVAAAQQLVASGQGSLTRLQTQIERDQSVLARSRQQLATLQADSTQMDMVEAQVSSLKNQTDEQTASIEMVYQPAVARAEDRVKSIEAAVAQIPDVEKRLHEANGKAKIYTNLSKAFHRDGIPTLILENGIPVIEAFANEILDRMPDKYRLRILTQREKKKGGMADRVDIVVERGSGKPRAYSNLSGGQKFRVDFALRIALGRVLAHRSGATIDTLALDEGWGTQDKRGVEALLESLAAVKDQFGLSLIITHHESVIDQVRPLLRVELSEEGISSVTLEE